MGVLERILGKKPVNIEEEKPKMVLPANADANIAGARTSAGANMKLFQDRTLVGNPIFETAMVQAGVEDADLFVSAQGVGTRDGLFEAVQVSANGAIFEASASASSGTRPAKKESKPKRRRLFG